MRHARNGYFARIIYPRQVEPGARVGIKVTLKHLRGKSPKQTYRRYRLAASVKKNTWETIRRAAASNSTSVTFHVRVPSEPVRYRLRLELERRNGLTAVVTRPIRLRVVAPSVAVPPDLGSADDWSSISGKNVDGTPIRWDPCTPIRWTFNPNGTEAAYPQALEDTATSIARISAHTGLTFEYVGLSSVVPYAATDGNMIPVDDTTPDLFIGFARHNEVPLFSRGTIGLGGPAYYRTDLDKTQWIDSGGAVLNTALLDSMNGINDKSRILWRSLITHEVLHAVGLGHSAGEQQVMYPYIRESDRFGAGDITGMQVHGAAHGCAAGFPDRAGPASSGAAMSATAPAPPMVHSLDDLHLSQP